MFAAAVELHGAQHHDRLQEIMAEPWAPVRALWGTDTASRAGARAMMTMAGGPAAPRDPSKARPKRG